jgi:hypothetical protein
MLPGILIALMGQGPSIKLDTPFLATAGGKPIKVDIGHSAPILADFNDDKLPDLLVGQFGEGKLRIYKNVGTRTQPKFDKFEWFQAGGTVAKADAG